MQYCTVKPEFQTAWDRLPPEEQERRRASWTHGRLVHISDTLDPPQDDAQERVEAMYQALAVRFGFAHALSVGYVRTEQGRPLENGSKALHRIGQGERAAQLYGLHAPTSLAILLNNAPRSDHPNGHDAVGDKCLYAQVGGVPVVGVGPAAFAPLRGFIDRLCIVHGISKHPFLHELHKGSQFRSAEKFTYPHVSAALGTIRDEFDLEEVTVEDAIPHLDLQPNEALVGHRDKFGNIVLWQGQEQKVNGIDHLCAATRSRVGDTLRTEFIDPDTHETIPCISDMRIASSITAHTGEVCVWPSSSFRPDLTQSLNLGISQQHSGQRVPGLDALPIGTKVVFTRMI